MMRVSLRKKTGLENTLHKVLSYSYLVPTTMGQNVAALPSSAILSSCACTSWKLLRSQKENTSRQPEAPSRQTWQKAEMTIYNLQ